MVLIPRNDKVIVQRDKEDEKTPGGLILPDIAKNKPQQGTVVATGPGGWNESRTARAPIDLKAGERVAFTRYAGSEIEYGGETFLILSEEEILTVITKKE